MIFDGEHSTKMWEKGIPEFTTKSADLFMLETENFQRLPAVFVSWILRMGFSCEAYLMRNNLVRKPIEHRQKVRQKRSQDKLNRVTSVFQSAQNSASFVHGILCSTDPFANRPNPWKIPYLSQRTAHGNHQLATPLLTLPYSLNTANKTAFSPRGPDPRPSRLLVSWPVGE